MLAAPLALWVVRMGDVIGWGQFPLGALFEAECEIFGMVVTIARHDVKGHPAPYKFMFCGQHR